MIVVSDTSPISNLLLIGRLFILERLYQEILVPPAVHAEVLAMSSLGKDVSAYEAADWVTVQEPIHKEKINSLTLKLDQGESEAIALAIEIGCDLLLMDERRGTRIAREEGLRTIGLAGVIIDAKRRQIISEVRPLLEDLRSEAGFWLGENLEARILAEAGEL
jgi:predicted nucleic acid-binding protein